MKFAKRMIMIGTLIAGLANVGVAFAADDKPVGSGPNPYSDCGIGAALFGETKWAAVTSNVTWDLGSTAITSGTVSPHTCSGKQVKVAMFINDTYAQLAEETAAGEGVHLAAVMSLSECNQANRESASLALRDNMAAVVAGEGFASKSHIEKATSMYFAVETAVSATCAI